MLNTRFDRLVNPPPNNDQVDPHGAVYEKEESVADYEILREEVTPLMNDKGTN